MLHALPLQVCSVLVLHLGGHSSHMHAHGNGTKTKGMFVLAALTTNQSPKMQQTLFTHLD